MRAPLPEPLRFPDAAGLSKILGPVRCHKGEGQCIPSDWSAAASSKVFLKDSSWMSGLPVSVPPPPFFKPQPQPQSQLHRLQCHLAGIENIGIQIEQPFAVLPLDRFSAIIEADIVEMLQVWIPGTAAAAT